MKALIPDPQPPPGTVRLPMREITDMFNAPPVDPLSSGLPEVLGISGVDYLLQELEIKKHVKLETVRVR